MRTALLVLLGLALIGPPASAGSMRDRFERARYAYGADRFHEAAAGFAAVLEGAEDNESIERSRYLLTAILLLHDDVDVSQLIAESPTLAPGLTTVAVAVRRGDSERAAAAVAYLRLREDRLPRATRRLLDGLEARVGRVASEYASAWERELAYAADLDVDSKGRLWVLVAKPPSFVRIDDSGEVTERVPFVPPATLDGSFEEIRFSVAPDGQFQVGAHRYDADGIALGSVRVFHPVDVEATEGGQVVFLHADGLRATDAKGDLRWNRLGRGRRRGSFHFPVALTTSGDQTFVAEPSRLQKISESGELIAVLDAATLAGMGSEIRLRGVSDIASAEGRIFLGHLNSELVSVFSADLKPLTSLRLSARRIAVAPDGMIFGLKDEQLAAAFFVPDSSRRRSRDASAISGRAAGSVRSDGSNRSNQRPSQFETPIHFEVLDALPSQVRVHVSTRFATSMASSSVDSSRVWIGTYGGVLQARLRDSGDFDWKNWTRADGLPNDVIHDLFEAADGALWAMSSGDVVVRPPNATNWRRLFRGDSPVNGKAVIGDRGEDGFIWIAAQRGILRLRSDSTMALFIPMARSPSGLVLMPEGTLLCMLGADGIARVDPKTGKTKILVEMEDLRRVAGLRDPTADRWILSLSGDLAKGVVWIGTDRRELFALDPRTGKLTGEWIDGAIRPGCRTGEIQAQRILGKLHVLGSGCYAVRDSGTKALDLVLEHSGRGRRILSIGGGLMLATTDGLHFFGPAGNHAHISSPASEPPDWAPVSMAHVDGRLWVGHGNRGIGVYDNEGWREIDAARSIDRLRVGADQSVLAVASYGHGQAFRYLPGGLEQSPITPGGPSWTYLRDLFYDGNSWWGVGARNPRLSHGLRRWREGIEMHWGEGQGMPFREARRILPDRTNSTLLWLATDAGLVRFDKENHRAVVVSPGDITWLASFDDRFVWAYGRELLRYDTRSGLGSPFPISGLPAPDPVDVGVLWFVEKGQLLRVDAETGSVLRRVPIGLSLGSIKGLEIIDRPEGRTAWILEFSGLLEVFVSSEESDAQSFRRALADR